MPQNHAPRSKDRRVRVLAMAGPPQDRHFCPATLTTTVTTKPLRGSRPRSVWVSGLLASRSSRTVRAAETQLRTAWRGAS